jgi:hypothetical protein
VKIYNIEAKLLKGDDCSFVNCKPQEKTRLVRASLMELKI